jgi:hypothetical protein
VKYDYRQQQSKVDYPLDWLIFFNNAVGHSLSGKKIDFQRPIAYNI